MLVSKISRNINTEILEGEGLKEWIKFINPRRCDSTEAWEGRDFSLKQHYSCTLEIAKSDTLISTIMNEIEDISKLDQVTIEKLLEEIWLLFEDMTLQQQHDESSDLKKTFAMIFELLEKRADNIPKTICSLNLNCAKASRAIVLQLKLIQLGYYGPSQATVGSYLAHHRKRLGPYFTNSINNRWPYQPLNREPNGDEKLLNDFMIKLTESLSHFTNGMDSGRLKNVSILDLPAFGSRLSYLNEFQTNTPNWPNEVNFAILDHYNSTELGFKFETYKYLIRLWSTYVDEIMKNVTATNEIEYPFAIVRRNVTTSEETKFPPDVVKNPFNFTQYIQDDEITFLQIYTHAYPTGRNNSKIDAVWNRAAVKVFGATLDEEFVKTNGLFDSPFLDCSFKEQFMKAGVPLSGKCDLFHKSLTSNGLCLSFNTETPSNIWTDSFSLAKDIEEIEAIKPKEISKFAGAGPNDGEFSNNSFLLYNM